jgi:hypothetical protein
MRVIGKIDNKDFEINFKSYHIKEHKPYEKELQAILQNI